MTELFQKMTFHFLACNILEFAFLCYKEEKASNRGSGSLERSGECESTCKAALAKSFFFLIRRIGDPQLTNIFSKCYCIAVVSCPFSIS